MEESTTTEAATTPRVKRPYTLAEDRKVPRWYETRHVPWMLRRTDMYERTAIKAGRVLHLLRPGGRMDAVGRLELEDLLATAGERREAVAAELPRRRWLPDWLGDLQRLAALSGETDGATLDRLAAALGWRPDQIDPSPAARRQLHRQLYVELEPLLRQAMREDRADRLERGLTRRR